MGTRLSQRILRGVEQAAGLYHRLVLVVGPPQSGKTTALQELARATGWPLLNVNLLLCERLLELTGRQRAVRTPKLLDDIVRGTGSDVVLLDNLEVLFSRELAQDPLRLLQGLSRHRTIVASWAGAVVNGRLTYAEPGHPEARRYTDLDAIVIEVTDVHRPTGGPGLGAATNRDGQGTG